MESCFRAGRSPVSYWPCWLWPHKPSHLAEAPPHHTVFLDGEQSTVPWRRAIAPDTAWCPNPAVRPDPTALRQPTWAFTPGNLGAWGPSGESSLAGEDLRTTPALWLSPVAEGQHRAKLRFLGQSRTACDGQRSGRCKKRFGNIKSCLRVSSWCYHYYYYGLVLMSFCHTDTSALWDPTFPDVETETQTSQGCAGLAGGRQGPRRPDSCAHPPLWAPTTRHCSL